MLKLYESNNKVAGIDEKNYLYGYGSIVNIVKKKSLKNLKNQKIKIKIKYINYRGGLKPQKLSGILSG